MNIGAYIHRLLSKLVTARAMAPTFAQGQITLDEIILASKRQLLEIFDGITDPILIVDRNFRILRLNKAMLSFLDGDKTYTDYIGRHCYEVLHEKQDPCNGECPIAELFTTGKLPTQRLFEHIRGHEKRTFSVSVFPLKDKTDNIYATVKYFKDITYLIQLEAELHDMERSRVLGSIALGLAHEIRNPLAIISSVAQYLQKDVSDNNDICRSMETIIRNAEAANNVIADLLNFARPKEKKIEVVCLDSVLDEGLRLLKNKLSMQMIKVEKRYDRALPKMWLDRSNFIHAFINIVLNAVDSMAVGGTITIETKGKTGHVYIAISDTGRGYPPEVIDRMLKPFFRSKGGPVDLRLPIAEDIIKSYGGSIDLRNNREVGATATIHVPLIPGDITGKVG